MAAVRWHRVTLGAWRQGTPVAGAAWPARLAGPRRAAPITSGLRALARWRPGNRPVALTTDAVPQPGPIGGRGDDHPAPLLTSLLVAQSQVKGATPCHQPVS